MGLEIVLSLVGVIGVIVVALINADNNKKINEKLNESQSKKIEVEADKLLFDYKNTVIKDLHSQVSLLRKEVDILKTHEILHLEEKIRLENKIESLVQENKMLETKMNSNKSKYDEDLIALKKKLSAMAKEIDQYKSK